MLSLCEHCRDLHHCNRVNKIKAGDVVLIKTPNKSRPYWGLGRVWALIVGHDNAARSVKLKRGDGLVVHHSVNHLYQLKLSLTHAYRNSVNDHDSIVDQDDLILSAGEKILLLKLSKFKIAVQSRTLYRVHQGKIINQKSHLFVLKDKLPLLVSKICAGGVLN